MSSSTTAKQFVTEKGEPIFGIMAEFATPADVYHAAERIRDAGYTKWDLYSPFPIHGIDEAMGITRTKLPLIVGAAAIVGVTCGYLLQWYGSNVGYKLVTQGKPYGSLTEGGWESFVPIMFEVSVLFAAFAIISISQLVAGSYTVETVKLYGIGLPFMVAGIWIGFKLYGTINDETFRKAVLILVLLAGLSLIVSVSGLVPVSQTRN